VGQRLPEPPFTSVLDRLHFAWVGAVGAAPAATAANPAATAAKLGALFETSTLMLGPGERDASLRGGCVRRLLCCAVPDASPERAASLRGTRCDRARFVSLAAAVRDIRVAEAALVGGGHAVGCAAGQRIGRRSRGGLPLPLVVVNCLLPSDPRLT
jgi:hypothetical protein